MTASLVCNNICQTCLPIRFGVTNFSDAEKKPCADHPHANLFPRRAAGKLHGLSIKRCVFERSMSKKKNLNYDFRKNANKKKNWKRNNQICLKIFEHAPLLWLSPRAWFYLFDCALVSHLRHHRAPLPVVTGCFHHRNYMLNMSPLTTTLKIFLFMDHPGVRFVWSLVEADGT